MLRSKEKVEADKKKGPSAVLAVTRVPLQLTFHPCLHHKAVVPVGTWNQHQIVSCNIGDKIQLFSSNFLGQGVFFTRSDPFSQMRLESYPKKKRTVVRILGRVLKRTQLKKVWIGGIFEKTLHLIPPKFLMQGLLRLARLKSPHLSLNAHPEEKGGKKHGKPYVSTPLFPLLDSLVIRPFDGKTFEEVAEEMDLNEPLLEDWIDATGFELPSSFQKQDPTGLTYRKSLNWVDNVQDFPDDLWLEPTQFIGMEFTDAATDMTNFSIVTPIATVSLGNWTSEFPFAVFEFGDDYARWSHTHKTWECIKHGNRNLRPSDLSCCFPPPLLRDVSLLGEKEETALKDRRKEIAKGSVSVVKQRHKSPYWWFIRLARHTTTAPA